ncbi:MAG: glycosyltransferase family 1 protein [Luteimonas sp.]
MADASSSNLGAAHEPCFGDQRAASAGPSVWTAWLALLETAARSSQSDQQSPGVEDHRAMLLSFLKDRSRPRQLLIDVSDIARMDHGGGIQRVTNRLLGELLFDPPKRHRIEPVRVTDEGVYVYARQFLSTYVGLPADSLGEDQPIEFRAGDHFLGLDLIRDCAEAARPAILAMRRAGVGISFVVYDLLPYTHPQWFPPGIDSSYNHWLHLVAETADLALCISECVCSELKHALEEIGVQGRPPVIMNFPLGADFAGGVATPRVMEPLPIGVARFLIVGTIERRKGHRMVLDAFETLWAKGNEVQLVLVGKPGWLVGPLLDRLRHLRDTEDRLHWFGAVDDSTLASLYRESTALLAPSEGEGYGLPLIEARWSGLPILARDMPVFREVAGVDADYFPGDHDALVHALQAWLARWSRGEVVAGKKQVGLWSESAKALKAVLAEQGAFS